MRKKVKLNSYEPLVRDKSMKFVTRSWYNKIFPFVKPFEFLKRNKIFQCRKTDGSSRYFESRSAVAVSVRFMFLSVLLTWYVGRVPSTAHFPPSPLSSGSHSLIRIQLIAPVFTLHSPPMDVYSTWRRSLALSEIRALRRSIFSL